MGNQGDEADGIVHFTPFTVNEDSVQQIGAILVFARNEGIPYATLETDQGDVLGCLWPDGAISVVGSEIVI
jgi:hypothetical protein